MNLLSELSQQAKFLLRNLRFTLTTTAVMATGFTLALFLFGFVYSTMYSELPFQNGQRIRVIDSIENGVAYSGNSVPQYVYNDFKKQVSSLQQASAFRSSLVTLSLPNQVRKYVAAYSEPQMFNTLGITPVYGEVFTPRQLANRDNVVLLSENSALEMFGSVDKALGANVKISGYAYRVTGILPGTFKFPRATDIWLPLQDKTQMFNRGSEDKVSIFGVLAEGTTEQQLNMELSIFMDNLRSIHPDIYQNTQLQARRFQQAFLGNAGEVMAISIEVAAILILLLASVNASNLLYLRALERKRESAIRLAIGASPQRLFIQMMSESLVICLLTALLSLVITQFLLQYLDNNISSVVAFSIPFWWNFQLTPMLAFIAIVAALGIATIAGIVPAWKMSKSKFVNTNLSEHKSNVSKSSKLLVVLEVFLASSILLVTVAFVFTINKQHQSGFSFAPEQFLSASIALSKKDFDTPQQVSRYYDELQHRLQRSSHKTVVLSSALPAHNTNKLPLFVDGAGTGAEFPDVKTVKVSRGFFKALTIPVLQGRVFNAIDQAQSPAVAVVTEEFAQKTWGADTAIGKRIKFQKDSNLWYQVVGVVGNTPFGETFDSKTKNQVIFTSLEQQPENVFKLLIKTNDQPYQYADDLRAVAAQVNSQVAPYRIKSLADAIDQQRASILYITKMFIFLSVVALVLTLSGVYSVVANIILNKAKEISIRIALGANYLAIFRFISSGILLQSLLGLALGVGLGSYLLSVLSKLQVVSFSPVLPVLLPLAFLAVIVAAISVPLHKVLKAPPVTALRQE